MKVIGYVRVSTDRQAETGYGLDTQKQAIKTYCHGNNLDLTHIYSDEGISGTEVNARLELMEMFWTLQNHHNEIQKIIVLNTSRLWRDEMAKVLIKKQLIILKVDVISIEQPSYSIHDKDPNNYLVNTIMETLDQYERMTINIKLLSGRFSKVKSGVKGSGNPPLGYKWSYEEKKPMVVIDDDNTDVVKEIFNKYLELKSLVKVSRYLNEQGYKTSNGNDFSTMAVHGILSNEFYIGNIKWANKQYDGSHEPLISKVIFGKVAAQLKRNKKHD